MGAAELRGVKDQLMGASLNRSGQSIAGHFRAGHARCGPVNRSTTRNRRRAVANPERLRANDEGASLDHEPSLQRNAARGHYKI